MAPNEDVQAPSGRFNALISIRLHESALSSAPSVQLEMESCGSVIQHGGKTLLIFSEVFLLSWENDEMNCVAENAACVVYGFIR